jgi:hypothetical protein
VAKIGFAGVRNVVMSSVAGAILLTGATAQAAAWYCQTIDGPGAQTCNSGTVSTQFSFMGSAAIVQGHAIPLYLVDSNLGFETFGYNAIRFAADYNFPTPCSAGNPEYYLYNFTSNNNGNSGIYSRPSLYQPDANNSWTAYVSGASIYAGYSNGAGPSSGDALSLDSTVGTMSQSLLDVPSFATFSGATYLFFGSVSSTMQQQIAYAKNSSGGWSVGTVLLNGGSENRSAPTAVVFGSLLYLFYSNSTVGSLSMVTYDGTSWSAEQVVDGAGPFSLAHSSVYGPVGAHPSTLVNGNTLYVFYEDDSSTYMSLRVATLQGGTWTAATVDPGSSKYGVGEYAQSAVYSAGVVRVYYFDNNNYNLKEAYLSGGTWHPNVIDGEASAYCNGAETKLWSGGVAAVSEGGNPHVFYLDGYGNVRVAWIQ